MMCWTYVRDCADTLRKDAHMVRLLNIGSQQSSNRAKKTSKTCQNELNHHKTLLFVIAEVTADECYLKGVDHMSRRNGSVKYVFLLCFL